MNIDYIKKKYKISKIIKNFYNKIILVKKFKKII